MGSSMSVKSKGLYVPLINPPSTEDEILESPDLKNFAFSELKKVTRNFRPDVGRSGLVFKGWIDENTFKAAKLGTGMVVAVETLNQSHDFHGSHQEWLAEINYLGQLSHPNLVKHVGYCLENEHWLLVFDESMLWGNWKNHLFSRASYVEPLSWNLRMKVALGVAKGLAYLHSPEAKVIYRVFKSSNILLDSDFNVKLSISESTKVNDEFHIIGYLPPDLCLCNGKEVAYAPPELVITGWSTTKSDTFGFGIVLLEILTGQEAFGYCKFVELVKPYMASKGKTVGVIDPSIEGQYCVGAALRAATIAMHCLRPNSKLRPNMNQVVNALEKLQEPHTTSSFHQVGDGATIER